jgi:hypothetical protein
VPVERSHRTCTSDKQAKGGHQGGLFAGQPQRCLLDRSGQKGQEQAGCETGVPEKERRRRTERQEGTERDRERETHVSFAGMVTLTKFQPESTMVIDLENRSL